MSSTAPDTAAPTTAPPKAPKWTGVELKGIGFLKLYQWPGGDLSLILETKN